ncbi:hypothetical protein BHU72_06065 [Desulfuribacillus stibiiarsenatis]|uniref:Uncharacterized protein n=1 Tax=Desulfuribacillus stibiiarsenatis TaxID=1390249 RepID=A0A1E5L591_9FIRM|nr:hypothetical protein BHU72_06065 [Desulfuribacillus stibiiarsenatis]
MTTTVDLIERGYFPQELPPLFQLIYSQNYRCYSLQAIVELKEADIFLMTYLDLSSKDVIYLFLIPLHHIKLCEAIEAN